MNLLRSLTGRLTLAQDTVDSDSSAAPSHQMEVKSFNEETCRTLPQICSEAKIYKKKMIDISKIICGGLSQIPLDKYFLILGWHNRAFRFWLHVMVVVLSAYVAWEQQCWSCISIVWHFFIVFKKNLKETLFSGTHASVHHLPPQLACSILASIYA